MTGQELYELYVKAQLNLNNCTVDVWDDLSHDDQLAWEQVAALTSRSRE